MNPLVRAYRLLGTAGTLGGLHEPAFTHRDAILMYHSIRPAERVRQGTSDVTREEFRRHLDYYTDRYEVVDLARVVPGTDPDPTTKRVALTFDDGYRDNRDHAAPILAAGGAPWTLFVTRDFAEGRGRFWWRELEEAVRRAPRLRHDGLDLPAETDATITDREELLDLAYSRAYEGVRVRDILQLGRSALLCERAEKIDKFTSPRQSGNILSEDRRQLPPLIQGARAEELKKEAEGIREQHECAMNSNFRRF